MERVTQQPVVMWGPTMVGFGSSSYTNTLGSNDWFDVGFSPRKSAMTICGIHDGYQPVNPLLAELGPHTTGKACLYVKRLDDINLEVLERVTRDLRALPARPRRVGLAPPSESPAHLCLDEDVSTVDVDLAVLPFVTYARASLRPSRPCRQRVGVRHS